jgi:hypothetical protein
MDTVYTLCAAVGCTFLVVQVALQLFGIGGGDTDLDADVEAHEGEGNLFFGLLSFKSLSAFVAFFGLAGLATSQAGIDSDALRLLIAALSGTAAATVVMLLMRALSKLQSSGNVNLDDLVGSTAKVHLSVPGGKSGSGKIMVQFNGREIEVMAMTEGAEVPTGAVVQVTRRIDGETFAVQRA